ncbi:MAG TPA: IS21 family transposase [Candidatus Methylomirabilis sp.]|nr:IS21 family transposase [Candidatus Methylomirabilis sp.]
MIDPELVAKIRLLFFAEHWKIGTIATQLNLHRDTVRTALETDRFNRPKQDRAARKTDPYLDFIRQTLAQYPRLRSTRILQMIRARGYEGGSSQLRRLVAQLRPVVQEPFLQLRTFPGQQGQADWAHFGEVHIGQTRRQLSCFVITLSYSRALALNFFFDQRLESLLCAHVDAFAQFQGSPRTILYDNMRSVVLARHENLVRFHPRLLELAAHYHFAPLPCRPARGNEKGRVERVIRYIRESFFAARPFTTLEDFNRKAHLWCEQVAHQRPWPQDDSLTVAQAFSQERPRLLPLPAHPLETDCMVSLHAGKTIYLRFDLNDYSIPPTAVGRALILLASPSTIRILQDGIEIARHRRSWDRHQIIEEPAHRQALLEEKRRALGASPSGRLRQAVPESEALLEEAFRRGESLGPASQQLLQLLDDYGAEQLRQAIRVALDRATPRLSSVAYILQQRRRRQQLRVLRPVHLEHRPDLADLHVQPHDSDTYDELSHNAEEDDEPRD